METFTELAVAVPGLRAVRCTSTSLHTGVKERYGVGRIEHGEAEWWGGGRTWRATRGSVQLKQPGDVVRHLGYREPTTFLAVMFDTREVESLRADEALVLFPQLEPGDPRARPFHRLLDAVARQAEAFTLEVAVTEAMNALSSVATYSEASRPVRRAVELLKASLDRPVSLDDLARHAGLDKFRLCRAFRAQIGLAPHAYLTHLRIGRAKDLLRRGVRASALAGQVGLSDQAQVTRHFRKLVGTTPARFAKTPANPEFRGMFCARG